MDQSMTGTRTTAAPVSVVIPAYNSRFIEETLASVYAQTVSPAQVIVINDGSTDDTEARVRSLAKELPSSFIWRSKENGGEASARNFGLRLADQEFIAFLDHDDIWLPEKLERQLTQLASDPKITLSFTGYSLNYEGHEAHRGRTREPWIPTYEDWDPDPEIILESLLDGRCPIATLSTVMIRRDALLRVTPFEEDFSLGSDYLMYLRFVAAKMKMDYLPEVLVQYRWHGSNSSRDIGVWWERFCEILDRFFDEQLADLPAGVRARARRWRVHWHLQTAIDAIRQGDKSRARRHIITAASIKPSAVRPGWIRMLGVGSPPEGPWP